MSEAEQKESVPPPNRLGPGVDTHVVDMNLDNEIQSQPPAIKTDRPYNPYKDVTTAYQLDESLAKFLKRLPPKTTTLAETSQPWIFIAYPYSSTRLTDPNIKAFKDEGRMRLDEYLSRKRKLEEQNPTKAEGSITRMMKGDRLWLEEAIILLARTRNVVCGKWMLFVYPDQVNDAWAKIAMGTLEGDLGCAAKVATDTSDTDKPERLICVYTKDFSDKADVYRVLKTLKAMDLVKDGEGKKAIYYKCDAYTYLDIVSGNDYKLKASMYSSSDLSKEMA